MDRFGDSVLVFGGWAIFVSASYNNVKVRAYLYKRVLWALDDRQIIQASDVSDGTGKFGQGNNPTPLTTPLPTMTHRTTLIPTLRTTLRTTLSTTLIPTQVNISTPLTPPIPTMFWMTMSPTLRLTLACP